VGAPIRTKVIEFPPISGPSFGSGEDVAVSLSPGYKGLGAGAEEVLLRFLPALFQHLPEAGRREHVDAKGEEALAGGSAGQRIVFARGGDLAIWLQALKQGSMRGGVSFKGKQNHGEAGLAFEVTCDEGTIVHEIEMISGKDDHKIGDGGGFKECPEGDVGVIRGLVLSGPGPGNDHQPAILTIKSPVPIYFQI
jgi:hypothetical protein